MNPLTLLRAAALGIAAFAVAAGASPALAQPQARPATAAKTLPELRAERAALSARSDALSNERDKLNAWIMMGAIYSRDLGARTRVAVGGDKGTVLMERSALRGSLQRHVLRWTMAEFARTGDKTDLRVLTDVRAFNDEVEALEAEALRESEAYRRKLDAEVEAYRDRADRLWLLQLRLLQQIEQVEDRMKQLAHAAGNPAAPSPEPSLAWPAVDQAGLSLSERKRILGVDLEDIRRAGNWSPDHHFQVGTFIGVARTFQELAITETLMGQYAACYEKKNADRATVQANARAGMYRTPGERIGELAKVQHVFDACIAKAESAFQKARGR